MTMMSLVQKGVSKSVAMAVIASVCMGANAKELQLKNSNVIQSKMASLQEVNSAYHIIQFNGKATTTLRKAVEALGAELKSYIPEDAILVKANKSLMTKIQKKLAKNISQVVPFASELKVDASIRPSVFNNNKTTVFVIRTLGEAETPLVRQAVSKIKNVQEQQHSDRTIYVSATLEQIHQISDIQGIEWIQAMPEMESMIVKFDNNKRSMMEMDVQQPTGDYTDLTGYESGTKIMEFDTAYEMGLSGEGQIVTMADTGLDSGDVNDIHPDFANVTHGYAKGLFSKSWNDPQGHGTHVAGSVMGSGEASGGLLAGGAPGAELIAEGMWSPIMNNLMVPPQLVDLFQPAYDDGSRIHTNSWGSPRNLGAYDNMSAQVDDYMWQNQDFLILFAAGNSGVDLDKDGIIDEGSVSSPGTAKNALTVGASENLVGFGGIQRALGELREANWGAEPIASDTLSDDPQGIAAFSSRGPTQDGRIKPEVVAPGTNIISARSSVKKASQLWGAYNEHYVYAGGTSMATPLTAGAAAVIRQQLEEDGNEAPSAAIVKAVLMHSATDLFPGQFGYGETQELATPRPNVHEGYGRVNVASAVTLKEGNFHLIHDEVEGISEEDEIAVPVEITSTTTLVATLTWTDAPGNTASIKTLVNDLDLELRKDGQVIKNLRDSTNNTEFFSEELEPGSYEVVVKASRIIDGIDGKQPFALIVTH